MSEQLIYLNGEFVCKENAKISVYDHGFLYGDGIFEGIRAYNGNIFRLEEHIERLYESALSILLQIPHTPAEMCQLVVETVRRNNLRDAYIRLVVSRGTGNLGLDPRSCPTPSVIIIAEQLSLFPRELYETGLRIITVPTRRNTPDALNPKIKSLNYLNNILVRMEAAQAGVSEALMLNREGYVAEGSGDNVFLVKKGILYTPPAYIGALQGITRQVIIEIAQQLGYVVKEEPFTRHDVYVADEVFLTGTAAEVISVIEVDGRRIKDGKPGQVTGQLLQEFRQRVEKEGVTID
ncbi:branched-chain-amino-acid transaminase [Brevibacillus fulvus]|uniref:Branched-chain-amino-acid aminotransferase n=1 Tax=Brevibacillus fulvus TaxID=1125967 RepID=A0A939BU01_9BACL|nr:branched-chain-amino-acid transaminase [Brevibacillus fulvus]MBM7589999.1 branched-chain amino acid aminotransferase [Brevibacillus fulvus]